jgi:hypothetical protein
LVWWSINILTSQCIMKRNAINGRWFFYFLF